jgi:beta-lactamase class A
MMRVGSVSVLLAYSLLIGLGSAASENNKNSSSLQAGLNDAVKGFHGTVGIYVFSPAQNMEAAVNADSLFPTASMIKVPILCTLWEEIAAGKLNPDSTILFYADSLHYPYKGEDALSRFAPGEDITVRQLMTHMITFSDNHASLYLQAMAGTGTVINQWLENHGFHYTRVNSRTPGREQARSVFGWGQTTPREMASLLLKIREGKIVNPAISEAVYRHLTRSYWNGEALSQIPPTVQAASKQGAVDESRSEVVLVNAPHGDYVFCVITKNQQDTSWARNNEGFAMIRKISALLWHYFEPELPYVQPADIQPYLP